MNPKSGFLTTEFYGMIVKVIASLLAMYGFISYDNVEGTTSALLNAAVAIGVVFANMKTVCGYIKARQEVKVAHANMMATVDPLMQPKVGAAAPTDSPCLCRCPCHQKPE